MTKDQSSRANRKKVRHTPLASQIEQDSTLKKRVRVGKLAREKDDITEEEYVSNKLSKKILEQAREQVEEESDGAEEFVGGEDSDAEIDGNEENEGKGEARGKQEKEKEKEKEKAKKGRGFKSFEEAMAEEDDDAASTFSEMSETESQYQDDITVNEEDERALAMFMNPAGPKRLLSDIIMEKLQEHEARETSSRRADLPREPGIKSEIMGVYVKVGELLRHHTSGKLPKAFRILPSLRNWEQLLYLTRPDRWTSIVFRMATVLFSRGMSDKLVQRFYFAILLPKIREEIAEKKKLNFHFYLALKRSLYRPGAFFRGILLPLCEEGDCSLREAVIIGSVLRRVSIPPIHASVAIYKLCQLPYYGATQHLLLILINKKFSLPYKVIDTIYEYFMNFMTDERKFPGLWHQTLLVFVQRYKGDLTAEQKEGLERLMKRHHHHTYTAETRRELHSVKAREVAPPSQAAPSTSMDM